MTLINLLSNICMKCPCQFVQNKVLIQNYRIDTPSLVSAVPQEYLIYWQNERKLTQNRLQSTDIYHFILFPHSSSSFTILTDLTITIALSLKNLLVTLTINFLNIHLDFSLSSKLAGYFFISAFHSNSQEKP